MLRFLFGGSRVNKAIARSFKPTMDPLESRALMDAAGLGAFAGLVRDFSLADLQRSEAPATVAVMENRPNMAFSQAEGGTRAAGVALFAAAGAANTNPESLNGQPASDQGRQVNVVFAGQLAAPSPAPSPTASVFPSPVSTGRSPYEVFRDVNSEPFSRGLRARMQDMYLEYNNTGSVNQADLNSLEGDVIKAQNSLSVTLRTNQRSNQDRGNADLLQNRLQEGYQVVPQPPSVGQSVTPSTPVTAPPQTTPSVAPSPTTTFVPGPQSYVVPGILPPAPMQLICVPM